MNNIRSIKYSHLTNICPSSPGLHSSNLLFKTLTKIEHTRALLKNISSNLQKVTPILARNLLNIEQRSLKTVPVYEVTSLFTPTHSFKLKTC